MITNIMIHSKCQYQGKNHFISLPKNNLDPILMKKFSLQTKLKSPGIVNDIEAVLLGEKNDLDVLLLHGDLCAFQDIHKQTYALQETTRLDINRGSKNKKQQTRQGKKVDINSQPKAGTVNNENFNKFCVEPACRGDMISMLRGEEILSLQDFQLNGLFSIVWSRLYRSSKIKNDIGLGLGWRHNYSAKLYERYSPPPKVGPLEPGLHWLEIIDQGGNSFAFDRVKLGETSYHASAELALLFVNSCCYLLLRPDEEHWKFNKINERWYLTTIKNALGHNLQLSYDKKMRLSRIACSPERGIGLSYNSMDHIVRIVPYIMDGNDLEQLLPDPLASYEFNLQGTLITAIDSNGLTECYKYFAGGLIEQRICPSGFSHYFAWVGNDENAKCSRQWGDDSAYDYTFEYDENKSSRTDGLGHSEFYYHDEKGLLTRFINARGHETTYQYDDKNRKIQTTNAQQEITRFIYNDKEKLIEQIETDGSTQHFLYNNFGKHIVTTNALGDKYKREFSASGRLLSETYPDGRKAHFEYNAIGLLSKKININGICTKLLWSDQGELLARKVADKMTRYSYDQLGRLIAVCDEQDLITEYRRNKNGQIVEQSVYQKGGDTAQTCHYEYDNAGCLTVLQDALGNITHYDYGGLSQLTKITFADGSWLKYKYDKQLNLTKISRSDEATYDIKYSPTQQPTQITGFDGRVQHYQYDELDNLILIKEGGHRLIKFRRDKRGRIVDQHVVKKNAKSNFNNHNNYLYDKLGRVLLAYNSERQIEQTYHLNGKIAKSVQDSHRVNYNYNRLGYRSRLTLPGNSQLSYQYNKNGLLSQINVCLENGKKHSLLSLSYNRSNLLVEQRLGNGLFLNQAFDAQSRLICQHWHGETHSNDHQNVYYQQRKYHYDALNQLINSSELLRVNETNKSSEQSYIYSVLRQLLRCDVKATTQSADHEKCHSQKSHMYLWGAFGDPQGVRALDAKKQEIYVEQDRLMCFKGSDHLYEECGNQIKSTGVGELQNRRFDGLNQLCHLNVNGKLSHYHYDALGRRSAKITETGKIEYIWDGDQLIGEYSAGVYRWYIYHPETFLPIALIDQDAVYYYHLDQLGTPVCLTDNNMQIVWQNNSDAFGYEVNSQQGASTNKITNPLRFQGQYFDVESALHYNRFRYYCPQQQRFIHQDPIGLAGGINHYEFCINPVNCINPFGL